MKVISPWTPLNPSGMPSVSKNRWYIQCSLVVGLRISTHLFCFSWDLTEKSILSKTDSSTSSSASSSTNVVTPFKDFRAAVWLPEDVRIPLKIIELPVVRFMISSLVILNSSEAPIISIFSINSGIIEVLADIIVYLENNIL